MTSDHAFPADSADAIDVQHRIGAADAGARLDQVAARLVEGFSRERLKGWILDGSLTLDGQPAKPNTRVQEGQHLCLSTHLPALIEDAPQALPLVVVHEDAHLVVIDKPAGLVVHPAAGHHEGTLLNALLHRYPEARLLPRAGIVHRLDKDTSGLMVVARTPAAHQALVAAIQARDVSREYVAVVNGVMTGGGTVDQPIGRHPRQRQKMAVVAGGKPAVTHYRLRERFVAHTAVDVQLETGRTHQIRVHMAWLGYPLVGDPVYGGRLKLPKGTDEALRALLSGFPRQALHAARLAFDHPVTGKPCSWESPLPADMQALLAGLRAHREAQW
ncbi:MAG: 23S rRNA pseudouridine(1911/1915/1917) synthase RluD [Gammaproteobacteria bacterium]|nr:MAG: 23S rRNA pseudouridine(1911/1915/1917) synthase RluD [Gammaproteobacteria bacterium]